MSSRVSCIHIDLWWRWYRQISPCNYATKGIGSYGSREEFGVWKISFGRSWCQDFSAIEKYISRGVDSKAGGVEAAVQIFHIKDWVWSLSSSSQWLGIQNFAWQNISAFSKETAAQNPIQSQIRAKKARNGQKISSQPLVLRHLDAGKTQFLLKKRKRRDRTEKSDFSSFRGFLPLNAFSVASIKILWMASEVSLLLQLHMCGESQ